MDLYVTTIRAICPKSGQLLEYSGPHVPGISFKDAQKYCENNGLGYCRVEGILVAEVSCEDKVIDYEKLKLN